MIHELINLERTVPLNAGGQKASVTVGQSMKRELDESILRWQVVRPDEMGIK